VEPIFEATKAQSQQAGVEVRRVGLFLLRDGKLKDSERWNTRSYEIL
jgi:Tetratricopeptide repeat